MKSVGYMENVVGICFLIVVAWGYPIYMLLWQVLEHLAIHKVLTVEHIYANPPRDGIERLFSPPNLATGSVDLEIMNLLCRTSKPVYWV